MDQRTLTSIEKLLLAAKDKDSLTPAQLAGVRARLTRLENETTDPDAVAILAKVRTVIGDSERPSRATVTVEDVTREFDTDYSTYDTRQAAAFKAKVTRMRNAAVEAGEDDQAAALAALQDRVEAYETADQVSRVNALLDELDLT